jgi:2-polyprenyl-3-methyl-5-hydroxy-6-metoxy-1,4-benzoquinol methylase
MVYMPEIPSPDAIESSFEWANSFSRERGRRWLSNPVARACTALFFLLKPSRARRALRRIRRHSPVSGRLLEIGAGDGRLAAAAQRAGYDVICVELSPAMAAKAAQRVGAERVRVGRLEDFALGHFHVVVMISLLEHEPEPLALLRRVAGMLHPGGVVVLKVPNYDCLLRRLRGKGWSGFRWPEHLQYFTPATMRALLAGVGLDVTWMNANPLNDNLWAAARQRR